MDSVIDSSVSWVYTFKVGFNHVLGTVGTQCLVSSSHSIHFLFPSFFGVSDFLNASLNSRPHVAYSRCVYCRQHGELRALSPWAGLVGRGWRYSLTLTLPWRRFSAPAWRQT